MSEADFYNYILKKERDECSAGISGGSLARHHDPQAKNKGTLLFLPHRGEYHCIPVAYCEKHRSSPWCCTRAIHSTLPEYSKKMWCFIQPLIYEGPSIPHKHFRLPHHNHKECINTTSNRVTYFTLQVKELIITIRINRMVIKHPLNSSKYTKRFFRFNKIKSQEM